MLQLPKRHDLELRYRSRLDEMSGPFPELSLVALDADTLADDGGVLVPAGTVGTVVYRHQGGEGLMVEFDEPRALVSVKPDQIRAA
ncbi:MAG: hypothetical protein JO048_09810 [Methylobacteriaceae bacterium]|nr:hypothetical protein [Methylobacteriaceae bacterium]